MSATPRSRGATGRPCCRPVATVLGETGSWSAGRKPALHALAALLALVTIGAATALLTPSPVAAQAEGDSSTGPQTAPPATETEGSAPPEAPPAEPLPPPPPPVELEEPPAAESIHPPQWSPTATYESPPSAGAPATQQTDSPPPAEGGPPPPEVTQEPTSDPGTEAPSQSGPAVGAHNQSTVFQAIWQEQVGCRNYCHGTSQSQSATQSSDTSQNASAAAPEGQGSGAVAVNQSSTVQFVWQMQLGCVAFCWDTTMNQSASQDAQTTQMATAVSDFAALAENLAETLQYVWQFQEGCERECYGVNESQSLSQRQTTSQTATATGPQYPTSAGLRFDTAESFFSWVTAFAQSIGATIETIIQRQEATCLEHCGEEALLQVAAQQATTNQTSTAGNVPEPVSEPPAGPGPSPAGSQPPPVWAPPPAGTPSAEAAKASAASETATETGQSTVAAPRRVRSNAAPAERRPFRQASTRSSLRSESTTTATRVSGRPEPVSGSGPTPSGPTAQTSARASTSSTESGTSPESRASVTQVTLNRSVATEAGDNPHVPWLPAALLLVAGVGVIQSLRLRPGFDG
jgi:hypothetical protein